MKKQDRLITQWAIEEADLAWLLKLCSFPIEILDAVVGVIYQDIFTVVGGHNLSINAPLSWMNEETLKDMLLTQQFIESGIDVIGYQHIITPPHRGATWDHQQIAPYSKKVFFTQGAEVFLKRWMELLTKEWNDEGDDEYNPFSLAFLHNHPIIRPEYLSPELRADYEVAYDLSGYSLPFTEWLKQLGQKAEFSVADQEFIRAQATDGIGLLVLGAEQHDVIKAGSIAPFVAAWQITQNGSLVVPGLTYNYQSMKDREFANFLYTISNMVRTTARQALRETSFRPAFAVRTDRSMHADAPTYL